MILAVANQKGGVGKTTTVASLATALAGQGRRVLAVDLDPQASLTFYLGHDEVALEEARRTLYHVLVGGLAAETIVIAGAVGRGSVDLLPSGISLAKAEAELLGEPNGAMVLREVLAPLASGYDLVLLDCPPSLGVLTVNALNAADGVLIPVKTQLLSLIGLAQILETVRKVRRRANPTLRVTGILPTMHHARNTHDAEVLAEIHGLYHELPIMEPVPNTTQLARVAGGEPVPGHEAYARVASALLASVDHDGGGLDGGGHGAGA